jgi:hypothetical protein
MTRAQLTDDAQTSLAATNATAAGRRAVSVVTSTTSAPAARLPTTAVTATSAVIATAGMRLALLLPCHC